MPRVDRRLLLALLAGAGLAPRVRAEASGSRALLMFERDGCAWCLRWHQEVGVGYPKSDEGLKAPLRVLREVDAAKAGATLKAPVTMAPTFVLVDQGREVGRIVGYPGAEFFYGLLGELMKKVDRGASRAPNVAIETAGLPT